MEKWIYDENSSVRFNTIKRLETELKWIKLLQSASYLGFYDHIYQKCQIFMCFLFQKFENVNADLMIKGKKEMTNVKDVLHKNQALPFYNLSSKLRGHGRHAMLTFLSFLPILVLRILGIEANRFYDRNYQMYEAALLTRCYTQHALHPFIDTEINHQRHFIKIPFINKGMDFIGLPSIFQDRSVTSSIPDYFQNSEPPIICYKYNKPIRHTIFNFNKLVSDLDIHANTPSS